MTWSEAYMGAALEVFVCSETLPYFDDHLGEIINTIATSPRRLSCHEAYELVIQQKADEWLRRVQL